MYVLMIVPSDFPNADAGAIRDMSFAKIYQKLGYNVVIIGMGKSSVEGEIEKVKYYSLYQERNNFLEHLNFYFGYKSKCRQCINIIFKQFGIPKAIHINDIPFSMINYLIKFSKSNQIPIVHDSTEWYSPCEFSKGKLDKSFILKEILNRYIIRSPIRVIAISNFLNKYFNEKGLDSIRIPVIMDTKNVALSQNMNDNKINFIYAGNPATKDYLKEIIEAVRKLRVKDLEKINVHIFGITENQIKEAYAIKVIPPCIRIYGRVPRKEVLKSMKMMDFSLLLRPEKERYTKAGFPTKVVEAMTHGVAMMCNISSDLGEYLIDKKNAIIVRECSSDALLDSIKYVLKMSKDEIKKMKRMARKTAEDYFDYSHYIKDVKKLIENKKEG